MSPYVTSRPAPGFASFQCLCDGKSGRATALEVLLGIEAKLSTHVPDEPAAAVVSTWQATKSTVWGGSSLGLGRGVSQRELLRMLPSRGNIDFLGNLHVTTKSLFSPPLKSTMRS